MHVGSWHIPFAQLLAAAALAACSSSEAAPQGNSVDAGMGLTDSSSTTLLPDGAATPDSQGVTNVVIYPDPVGLDKVSNLTKSPLYEVTVNGKPTFVYRSVNRQPQFSAIKEAHFAYFSFDGGPVTIAATKLSGPIGKAKVRPLSLGITPAIADKTLTFELSSPRKFMVQVDGDSAPLILFADKPDTDIPSGANVKRFGPGFHDIGRNYDVQDNQVIYVDGGAVVKGNFGAPSGAKAIRKGVTLRGRGIVYGGDYAWPGDGPDTYGNYGIFHQALDGSRIEGIIALDSEYWNFGIKNTNTKFEDIKIIAWEKNTDGIWVGPNSTIRDCFIMTDDDSLRPSTTPTFPDSSTSLVEDIVVWHEAYGRPFYLPNYYDVQNITYRNIEYIRSEHSYWAQSYIPTYNRPDGPRKIRNITFENVTFEEIITPSGKANQGDFFNWLVSPNSAISNITFRNVRTPITGGTLAGLSATERISDVTFEGVYRNGEKMTSLSQMGLTINANVDRVVFK